MQLIKKEIRNKINIGCYRKNINYILNVEVDHKNEVKYGHSKKI